MPRLAAFAVGASVGLLAGFFVARHTTLQDAGVVQTAAVRNIVAVPVMSDSAATAHREDYFTRITSIEQVLALPSDFAQSEALHALAGRSNADQLQGLIFDADRIADELDRQGALFILFAKLTELDPASALAITRTPGFEHDQQLRELVWSAWARSDLDGALAGASAQANRGDRALAAAGIYSAHGYLGNNTTDKIEAALGIAPDRSTRNRFLHTLISRSPQQAAAWIDELPGGKVRDEYLWWFAYEMSNREGASASQYARLFRQERDAEHYLASVERRAGVISPRASIERFFASGNMRDTQAQVAVHGAVTELAATDLDAAIAYLGQARNNEERVLIGSAIAAEYAAREPAEALSWARAADPNDEQWLVNAVLRKIAETDARFAIGEALAFADQASGVRAASQLIQTIAHDQPAEAAGYVSLVPAGTERFKLERQLANNWLHQDPQAAIDWILTRDDETANRILQQSARVLIISDVDAAIQALPRLDEHHQRQWRRQIVEHMATHRPPAEIEAFIRRFASEPGHEELEIAYITSLAATDVARARQLADQLGNQKRREAVYTSIIQRVARKDPPQAAAMLSSLGDANQKTQAASNIVSAWYRSDADGAQAWVSSLPRGQLRDSTIVRLAQHWGSPTQVQLALVDGIDDEQTRQQARLQLVFGMTQTNPQGARRLLDELDLPASQRAQIESALTQATDGFR